MKRIVFFYGKFGNVEYFRRDIVKDEEDYVESECIKVNNTLYGMEDIPYAYYDDAIHAEAAANEVVAARYYKYMGNLND